MLADIFSWTSSQFNIFAEYLTYFVVWFSEGIYDFIVEIYAWGIIKVEQFKWWWLKESLIFAWDIAHQLLIDLNISSKLTAAWSSLDSDTLGWLSFFRIPECINVLLNAAATRFVMSRMGF